MADAVVSTLVTEVAGRLSSQVFKELDLIWGFKRNISSLKDDFELIEAVLEDAQQQKHVKNNAIELWLKRLRSASLEVDNLLDEISTETLLRLLHKQIGERKVRSFFSFSSTIKRIKFRLRMAHKVKDIREKVNDIAMTSKKFELNSNPSGAKRDAGHMGVEGEMPDRETSSGVLSSVIFGRDEEIEMVTEKVCNKDVGKYDDDGEIRVYGIWGMGGIGKTTLAQLVYNHDKVKQCFELRCWVYVSENFQVKEIIKKIIESIGISETDERTHTQLDTLQTSLQNKLKEKKFLIVLDDVWIEDSERTKWDQLSRTLSCGAEGSIVVMTTRYQTTSQMMAKVPELQHKLGCLSKKDSWSLFKKLAFARGREAGDDVSELEPIGREIVEKCEGLPLAIKTLGGLMWSKTRRADWEQVKCGILRNLQENNVLSVLKLSYDNLLPYMKKCFGYCCLLPKGHVMKRDEVINLWVGNGCIHPKEQIDLYALGGQIFNCLVWRSFFQVVTGTDTYKMHDLMHDMAQNVMGDDCLVIDHEPTKLEIPDDVLHLSSSYPDFLFSSQDLRKLRSLRSVLMWGDINESCISQILNHTYLRVLRLHGLSTFPKSVCKLKHLRYLNLSYSDIEVLPESIIYLQNLQVMILRESRKLGKLPDGLRYMTNLQYLDIEHCDSIKYLPSGIKELTSLRIKLSQFPVGKESGAKIGEIQDLTFLDEKLTISRLENVEGLSDAESANLKCKRNLSVLAFRWSDMSPYAEDVFEGLEPNPSLKELKIYNYTAKIISSSWIVNLSNLVKICFRDCSKCERISSLGGLPNLRVIYLIKMSSLKCLDNDDTINMFPSLEELHIYSCPGLVSLPRILSKLKVLHIYHGDVLISLQENMFPSLEELSIHSCGNLISLPYNLPKLEILRIEGCEKLVSVQANTFPSLKESSINSFVNLVSLPYKYNLPIQVADPDVVADPLANPVADPVADLVAYYPVPYQNYYPVYNPVNYYSNYGNPVNYYSNYGNPVGAPNCLDEHENDGACIIQ